MGAPAPDGAPRPSPASVGRGDRRLHVALGVGDVRRSVEEYSELLGRSPVVVIDDEYALWVDDRLNLSIRASDEIGLRHLGWEDPAAESFTTHLDGNGLTWERFTIEQQLDEVCSTWPGADVRCRLQR